MALYARATSSGALWNLTDLIHDWWFWIDDVRYDNEGQILTIPFTCPQSGYEGERRKPRALFRWLLRIHHASGHEIVDTERIGQYDFNQIVYSDTDKTVRIETGIPLLLKAAVSQLDVTVEGTDALVEQIPERRKWFRWF
jgi:hypothetical protein